MEIACKMTNFPMTAKLGGSHNSRLFFAKSKCVSFCVALIISCMQLFTFHENLD